MVDLGKSPLCQTMLTNQQRNEMEPFYPLHVYVCGSCSLVQLEEYVAPADIFSSNYAYFSSYSDSWLEHARRYVDDMTGALRARRHQPGGRARQQRRLPPPVLRRRRRPVARHRARCATWRQSPRSEASRRWSSSSARPSPTGSSPSGLRADLVCGNNVLAQVPDLNDFVAGIKRLLAPQGVVTIEFPHLFQLIDAQPVRHHLPRALLVLLVHCRRSGSSPPTASTCSTSTSCPTHGGSLRIYGRHADDETKRTDRRGRRDARAGSRSSASTTWPPTPHFGEQGGGDEAPAAQLPHRGEGGGRDRRRLRRSRQGQHAAQLLRHPDRSLDIHR